MLLLCEFITQNVKNVVKKKGFQNSSRFVFRSVNFHFIPLSSPPHPLLPPSLPFKGIPLHSWVFTKGHGRGALTPTTPSDGPESTAIEVEDIPALLRDVVRFAEAVEKLKDVVLAEGKTFFWKKATKVPRA